MLTCFCIAESVLAHDRRSPLQALADLSCSLRFSASYVTPKRFPSRNLSFQFSFFLFFCLVITETENSSVESVSRSIASHVHSRIERCVSARAGACTWQGYRSGYFSEGTWKTCNWLQSLPFRTAHAGGHLSPITDIVLIPSRIYSVPRLTLI